MDGLVTKTRSIPWRGVLALIGGFLIQVRVLVHFIQVRIFVHFDQICCNFYRTQVYLGSDLWVTSVSK